MDPFKLMYRHLAERREALTEHLLSGSIQKIEDYRYTVGSLYEINLLETEVKDIERRFADE
jgi:hypothetical protein